MRKTHTIIALIGAILLFAPPIAGQKLFTLDKSTTTFIDNSLMECFYDYTVKGHQKRDTTKAVTITYNTLLQANAKMSKYWDWHTFKMDSILFNSVSPIPTDSFYKILTSYNSKVRYLYIPVIFKNYPKEKITVIDDIAPDMFLYEQPKSNFSWNLKEDTMTVCGYLCKKAMAFSGGREWTAWYAPEIAISDGPWKLYGLPGLILKAIDATGQHAFEAVVIRNAVRPIYLTNDIERMKIGRDQFLKKKLSFDKDPYGNLKLNPTIQDVTIMVGSATLINGKHTSILNDAVYTPLELQ